MANYVRSNTGCVLQNPSPHVVDQCEPVVVIPRAKWEQMLKLMHSSSFPDTMQGHGMESDLDDLIAEVE